MSNSDTYFVNRAVVGKIGFCLTTILAIVLAALAWDSEGGSMLHGDMGLCAPSPNMWHLPTPLSWGLNLALSLFTAAGLIIVNKRFNFIHYQGIIFASVFMLLWGCNPWASSRLGSPVILAVVNTVCIYLLFNQHGRRNAAQGTFVIFSTLSWLSMIQYAAVMMMPVYVIGLVLMNTFRFREVIAMLLGIVTPWWIMMGLGIVNLSDIHLNPMTNLFSGFTAPDNLFWLFAEIGVTGLTILLLTLYNSFNSPASGHRMRAYSSFINVLGLVLICFVVFDSSNMLAYTCTLNLVLGFQIARFYTLGKMASGYMFYISLAALYTAMFIATITF